MWARPELAKSEKNGILENGTAIWSHAAKTFDQPQSSAEPAEQHFVS